MTFRPSAAEMMLNGAMTLQCRNVHLGREGRPSSKSHLKKIIIWMEEGRHFYYHHLWRHASEQTHNRRLFERYSILFITNGASFLIMLSTPHSMLKKISYRNNENTVKQCLGYLPGYSMANTSWIKCIYHCTRGFRCPNWLTFCCNSYAYNPWHHVTTT